MPEFGLTFGFAWILSFLAPVAVLYLAFRFLRAFERSTAARKEIAKLDDRILGLEESLSAITVDFHRLEEGQRFTNQLLSDRDSKSSG